MTDAPKVAATETKESGAPQNQKQPDSAAPIAAAKPAAEPAVQKK